MKKKLFYYLFAALCMSAVFTACSDDDEDTTWQQIPEITSDNVILKLNEKALSNATATLDIINGESGKVTLKNAIYGHPAVDIDVVLEKNSETSYRFSGSTNLEAARMALSDAPLMVTVNGTVDTTGKVTLDVVTAGWAATSGVYANDSLAITFDGKAHSHDDQYAVTLTVTDKESAVLVFKKIINVGLDVEANVALVDGKISGTVEPSLGYVITISGAVSNDKLTLDLVSSGYGTIKGSYSASSNDIKFNGEPLTSGSVSVAIVEKNTAKVTFSGILAGSRDAAIEKMAIEKEEGKEVYTLKGEIKNADYAITFNGVVGEDRKLTADITYAVQGDIVGKWDMMKTPEGMAASIFKFSTGTGSVTLPESLLALIPENMRPMIPATMKDEQLTQLVQGVLGSYAIYLQSVEFTAGGRMIATYIDQPKDINGDGKIDGLDGNDMTPKTFSLLQYYMKDGQLYLTVSLTDLIGMMPTGRSARAWDPSNVLTEGIPVAYQVNGDNLSISLVTEVVVGLAGFVKGLLPFIGMMLPEEMQAQLEVIKPIFEGIMTGIIPDVKELEVGLVFTK